MDNLKILKRKTTNLPKYKHKVIFEQRIYINLCTQIKTILSGLPMYAYWPERVFVYVGGLRCLRVRECVCVRECATLVASL